MLDEDFLLWIKQPDASGDAFWNGLALAHPHQTGNISDASKLAAALNMQKDVVAESEKTRIWQSVLAKAALPAGNVVAMRRSVWWMAAAAIILIIGGFVAYRFLQTDLESIKTAWGEKRSVTLPDGSLVVLNANSQIAFDPHPQKNAPREVWMHGEAFFEVVHKNRTGTPVQEAERFIVHLPNMNVEVLGTTFTINTRREQEQVVLQTGSVKVQVTPKHETVYLKPGESISYNSDKKQLSKTTANATDAALWKENQLKFDNTPLNEIIKLVEDNYGYKVEVTDSSLLTRTIGGTLSSENEQILFKALENMLEVKITITGKTLTISRQ
ncbi:FecR family protein [Niastella populi]|nr:FecR domain-containing protein [Niastella populi]